MQLIFSNQRQLGTIKQRYIYIYIDTHSVFSLIILSFLLLSTLSSLFPLGNTSDNSAAEPDHYGYRIQVRIIKNDSWLQNQQVHVIIRHWAMLEILYSQSSSMLSFTQIIFLQAACLHPAFKVVKRIHIQMVKKVSSD